MFVCLALFFSSSVTAAMSTSFSNKFYFSHGLTHCKSIAGQSTGFIICHIFGILSKHYSIRYMQSCFGYLSFRHLCLTLSLPKECSISKFPLQAHHKWYRALWRTWLFISFSERKMIIILHLKGWEKIFFELGSKRDRANLQPQPVTYNCVAMRVRQARRPTHV